MTLMLINKYISVFGEQRNAATVSRLAKKLGDATEEMVARCVALDVQGGEHGSSRKTVTSWRFKSSEARTTTEHTVIESHLILKCVPFARHRPG